MHNMRCSPLLIFAFLASMCNVQGASDFRICAFNLQHFGESKSKKQDVMRILISIISRCDVCLLQEVRDSKKKAVPQLLESLNKIDPKHEYKALASERLGRSDSYKEQYVFVYRTDSVSVTGQYQYPDHRDVFSREPFVVRFKAPQTEQMNRTSGSSASSDLTIPLKRTVFGQSAFSYTAAKQLNALPVGLKTCSDYHAFSHGLKQWLLSRQEFVIIPQHTTPVNTTTELDALYDVLQQVKKMWETENVMLLGDFNADCHYLAKKYKKIVRMFTVNHLHWLIPDEADTTVRSSTVCAYDRIVVNGETFLSAIVPLSAKPFDFQAEYQLTEEQALEVSDHYPVEVLLRSAASRVSIHLNFIVLLIIIYS